MIVLSEKLKNKKENENWDLIKLNKLPKISRKKKRKLKRKIKKMSKK